LQKFNNQNKLIMEVQYNNLYTHFVFTTQDRFPAITEIHRERIKKISQAL